MEDFYNSSLVASIKEQIKSNNERRISGIILQGELLKIISALDLGGIFLGFASKSTNPAGEGKSNANGFYFSTEEGTYTYFIGNNNQPLEIGSDLEIIYREVVNDKLTWNHRSIASQFNVSGEENNFASFDGNGGLKDSGCNEDTFIKGVKKGTENLNPDENGVVTIPSDIEKAQAISVSSNQDANANIVDHVLQLEIPRGADAVNPFKGIYGSDNKPTGTFAIGDYLYAPTSDVSQSGNTIWKWNGTNWQDSEETPDLANSETFASSETLQQVAIDKSGLVNPVNTANPNMPVLSRAEDVMQLKAKLEGVTAIETKGSTSIDYNGYIVCKTTDSSVAKTYKYDSDVHTVFIPIPQNAKKIRFLGRFVNANTFTTGYAFINAESPQVIQDNIIVSSVGSPNDISRYIVELHPWVNNGTNDNTEIPDVAIPDGATYFCAVYGTGSITQSNFYCYLQSGDTVKDELEKMDSNNKNTYGMVIQNNDYLRVVVDANNHFLFGIKKDGSIEWSKGVPQPVLEALEEKVSVEEGKELVESRYVTEDANNKYMWLLLDNEQRILLSVDKEGNVNWSKGIPEAIKNYIAEELSFSTGSANIDYMRPTIKDLGIRMLDLQVDSNGYELPATNGQRECLKIAEEFRGIRIDWKGDVPGCYSSDGKLRRNFYTVNSSHYTNGIPYSAVGSRQVGFCVSIYTFMTAANNPFSLLYTEDTSNSHPSGATDFGPRSAWGRNYTGSKNAGTYYGTICSHFGQFATGSNFYNNTVMQKKWLLDYTMQLVQSAVPNIRVDDNLEIIADIDDIRIGDLVVYVNKQGNAGHCRLITSIKRDSNFKITEITTTEALPNYASDVQVKTQTRNEFIKYISGGGDNYDSESGGTGWLCRNLDIVKAKHNPSPMWIAQQNNDTYQYNNDICTYAGDKCVFKNGDLVVLNYNLNNASDFDSRWQGIRLYKYTTGYHGGDSGLIVDYNKQLVNTYLFADFDNINLENYGTIDASQTGHALVLGTELESGSYMACMFNEDDESEATMFEVIDIMSIDVSQYRAIIEVTFDKSDNVDEIIRATVWSEDLKTAFAFYDLTYNNNIKSSFNFNVVELNKIQYNGSLRSGDRKSVV